MSAPQICIGWNEVYQQQCRLILNVTSGQWDFHDWNVELGEEGLSQSQSDRRRDSAQGSQATAGASVTPYTGLGRSTSSYQSSAQEPYMITTGYSASNAAAYHTAGYVSRTSHQSSGTRRPHANLPRGEGALVHGEYVAGQTLHYEKLDPSFFVREASFFTVGKVFAVMWNETAGSTVKPTDYNTSKSINQVKYAGNYVHTNVRRFIVVKRQVEFCYACPIYTYGGRATTKMGVRPEQHGVAHTWDVMPQLLQGEVGITKAAIRVVMTTTGSRLDNTSRVYYGIHHPVQYNVKVKDIGYVPQAEIPTLIGNWREEDERESRQAAEVTDNAEQEELPPVHEEQSSQGA